MKSLEIPDGVLDQIAQQQKISSGELAALKLALQKQKSKDIAQQLNISEVAVRKRLGEVYKKFGIKGKGPGKLAALEATLGKTLINVDYALPSNLASDATYEQPPVAAQRAITPQSSEEPAVYSYQQDRYSWGSAPVLDAFQGRQDSLKDLELWIDATSDSPLLLAICGIGGIGKSYLAKKLAENIGDSFQQVVWVALEENKSPASQLRSLLDKLEPRPTKIPLRRVLAKEPLPRQAEALEPSLLEDRQETSEQLESAEHSEARAEVCRGLIRQIVALFIQRRLCVVLDGFDRVFEGCSRKEQSAKQNSLEKRIANDVETRESAEKNLDTKVGSTGEQPMQRVERTETFVVSRQQQSSLYKDGFEAYGELLTTLQKCRNRKVLSRSSCLMITSREKPKELSALSGDSQNSRLCSLGGLTDAEATEMLATFNLKGSAEEYGALAKRYYGHPMALRLSANTVRDVFDGRIQDFLKQDISVFDDLRSLLKTQFKRLSPAEEEVMYWLAINHHPCTLDELREDVVAEDSKRNMVYTLKSLQGRSLIQIDRKDRGASFHLHPIVADYVLDRFVRSIFQDLRRYDLHMFNSYALMKADAEDDIRAFQLANIVQPILERLKNHLKSVQRVETYLGDRLDEFREGNPYRLGYAGGNFLNLLVQLSQGHMLKGKDFSKLAIWQAYLQRVQLNEVTFNRCQLDRSVFTETLSDVMAIAFSNQSTPQLSRQTAARPLLAAGDANGKVHIWPAQASKVSSRKCFEWVAHSSWTRAITFVPGQAALVTGGDDNLLKLWRLPDKQQQSLDQPALVWQKRAHDWIHAVAVSPDGQTIASGGKNEITLYRISSGEPICCFSETLQQTKASPVTQQNRVRALAFSPDGRWLASGRDDGTIRIWATETVLAEDSQTKAVLPKAIVQGRSEAANRSLKLSAHSDIVHTVCFSPDSKQLVSGSADSTLRVWDVESGCLQKTFERSGDRIRSVAISPDGLIVSSGDDCQIRLWDINTLRHIKNVPTGQSRIWSVAFQQQDKKLLLSAGGDKQTLMLWQVNTNKVEQITQANLRAIRTYRGYTNGIRAVAFLRDDRIVGGGDGGDLSAWDIGGDRKATLPFHDGRIWAMAVDRTNKRIASASDDYLIRLWNAETGECLTTLAGHNNWVRAVDFSRHGRFLASGGDDCNIRIWNTASGYCRRVLRHSNHWVRSVQFDPTNSRYLISAGDEQVVRHWDIKEEISRTVSRHEHRVCSVAYSLDGRLVASASDDTTVILCDVSDMQNVQQLYQFADADLCLKAVAFSPNGRYLAAGGDDQLVYVWDLEATASPVEESCVVLRPTDYAGFSGGVRSLAFSPEGRYIISGGLDEMIRVGDMSKLEDVRSQVLRPLFVRDRPYESIKIEGVTGLSQLQLANLISLGAVNQKASLLM